MVRAQPYAVVAVALSAAIGLAQGIVHGQTGPAPTVATVQTASYFFKDANADSEYKVMVPAGYRAGTATPLVVALHGNGSTPGEILNFKGLTQIASEHGYIVIAPMGFNPYAGYGSRGPGRSANRPDDPENAGALSELDVLNVIDIAQHQYTIDAGRVFLLGHSMGGAGALYLGARYPDRWAGMALFAPGSRGADRDVSALKNIPVIIFQGKDDEQVLPANTRRLAALMRRSLATFEYHEQEGDHMSIIGWTPPNIERTFEFFEKAGRSHGRLRR